MRWAIPPHVILWWVLPHRLFLHLGRTQSWQQFIAIGLMLLTCWVGKWAWLGWVLLAWGGLLSPWGVLDCLSNRDIWEAHRRVEVVGNTSSYPYRPCIVLQLEDPCIICDDALPGQCIALDTKQLALCWCTTQQRCGLYPVCIGQQSKGPGLYPWISMSVHSLFPQCVWCLRRSIGSASSFWTLM